MASPWKVKQKSQGRPADFAEKENGRIGAHQRSCEHAPAQVVPAG